jgi:hypothetical protein
MTKPAPTPTPWHLEYLPDCDNPPMLLDSQNNPITLAGRTNQQGKINAAYIVKAVNAHEMLIEALELLGAAIEHGDPQTISDLWCGQCTRTIIAAKGGA